MLRHVCLIAALLLPATVQAEQRVTDKSAFLAAVRGKSLTFRLFGVRLQVSPSGQISGQAQGKPVTGQWAWKDGYFCRSMRWGAEDLPYNCQRVDLGRGTIRFTSDRGAGQTARFGLR